MKKRASFSTEIAAQLEESAALKRKIARTGVEMLARMAWLAVDTFNAGGKLLICGNGGSAADAQHLAGEMVGRFMKERSPLSCIALSTDSSVVTAIGNDYGFEHIFARQVAAHGKKSDLLLAISTSGDSPNILKAVEEAKRVGMGVIAFSGRTGGRLAGMVDLCITVPAKDSPRIQEVHGTMGHILCGLVEKELFGR